MLSVQSADQDVDMDVELRRAGAERRDADSVRVYANVCEDHGRWLKDPCSIRPTQKFNY